MQNPNKLPELVSLTTQDINDAEPITTSLKIAEMFEKNHQHVLRDCDDVAKRFKKIGQSNFGQSSYLIERAEYTNSQNRKMPMYIINEKAFVFIVMGYTGEKADLVKAKFINEFYNMRHELMSRANTRAIGKLVRKSLTDVIKECVSDEGNFKHFAYSNYTKLIYKKVLGMDVKKAKQKIGAKEHENIRDFLSPDELAKVQEYERKIAGFIQANEFLGMDDKAVYKTVRDYFFGKPDTEN